VADFLPDRLLRRVVNAQEVFPGALVFDQWICNSGRREFIFSRPASEDGASYSAWLIDHDRAFNDGNWKLPKAFLRSPSGERFVYHAASGIDSFSPVLSRIENLGADEISHAARCVPVEWCSGGLTDILNLADRLFTRRKQVRQALSSILPSIATLLLCTSQSLLL
jgi:hypothetical protein